jgi:small basic protein
VPGLFCNFTSSSDEYYAKYDWLVAALRADRESLLRMDAFRSLFFISAVFAMLWFYLKNKLKINYLYIGLIAAVLIDMWIVDKRYFNDSEFISKSKSETVFQPSNADLQIMSDSALDYRVMNTTVSPFNDASTSYFHKSIGGYHGAKMKRYQELIENQISKNNMEVLDMLNTKYFIVKGKNEEPEAQLNPGALGNAWFVKNYKVVENADSEINALSNFNPRDTAIIDKRFTDMLKGFTPQVDSGSVIALTSYKPHDLVYKSKTSTEQFAVFSEIYYDKGWNAYVDGKLTPHFRVNYVLRAMRVPAGEHTIEFKFEPKVFNIGGKITGISSILLYFLLFGALYLELKKSGKTNEI